MFWAISSRHLRLFLVALLLAGLALISDKSTLAAGQDGSGRKPAGPDQTALGKAEALIMKLYKAEYQASKTDPAAARSLAAILLREAKATNDDKDLQFAAFLQASDLAIQGGNVALALSAIAELTNRFSVDTGTMKRAVLTSATERIKTAEGALELIHAVLAQLNEMMADDDADDPLLESYQKYRNPS